MATIGTNINLAQKELNQSNLVGIPTETVYGLAGNALDPKVVAKIFEVKKRPSFDPLIVHVRSMEYLNQIVESIPSKAERLMKAFWPGPLTLVLPKKELIPDLVTSGLPTVAVRIPNHRLTLQLLAQLDFPLASPSANPFGYVSPTTADHVETQLGNDLSYILDGGPCVIGIESTIIGFESEQPVLLRPGGIPLEDIEKLIGPLHPKQTVSKPAAPGMLKNHYAPEKKLLLGNIRELLNAYPIEKAGILSFSKSFDKINSKFQVQLSVDGNLSEAAQNLFGSLRKLDAMPITYIFAESVPNHGLGIAINDRLMRASFNN